MKNNVSPLPCKLHVIIVPYIPWHLMLPSCFDELENLFNIMSSIFSLDKLLKTSIHPCKDQEIVEESLLYRLLRSKPVIYDVLTKMTINDIDRVFASSHQLEAIFPIRTAKTPYFPREHAPYLLELIESDVSKQLTFQQSGPLFFGEIFLANVVIVKNKMSKELANYSCTSRVGNAFNFTEAPWSHCFFPDLILIDEENEKLIKELRGAVALSSLYYIHESLRGAISLLKIPLREMVWQYFKKWEKNSNRQNHIKRFIKRVIIGLDDEFSALRERIFHALLPYLNLNPETLALFYEVYGIPYLPYVQAYIELYKAAYEIGKNIDKCSFHISPDDVSNILIKDFYEFSEACRSFISEFNKAYRFFLDCHRRRVESNRFILTLLFGTISLIISMLKAFA